MNAVLDTRAVEALLTTLMLNYGVTLVMPGDTFNISAYSFMARFAEDWQIGLFLLVVGAFRWVAVLYTNRFLPYFRVTGAAIGGLFWLVLGATLFVASDNSLPGMFSVAASAVAFEIFTTAKVISGIRKGTAFLIAEG